MAVIDEYYSSRLDLGPPAAVAYLSGFMGERERMNRAVIDRMLAVSDPKALAEAERDARKAKNDLLKLKASIQTEGRKADVQLAKAILGYYGVEKTAKERTRAAEIAARGGVARTMLYHENTRQKQINEGEAAADNQLNLVRTPPGPQASDADRAATYDRQIVAALSNAGASGTGLKGEAQRAAQAKIAAEAYATASKAGDEHSKKVIRDKYFGGKEPSVYRDENFRRKTEAEINEDLRKIPLGGAGPNQDVVQRLATETDIPLDELQGMIYGLKDNSGRPLSETLPSGPRLSGEEIASGAVAALGGSSPGQAPPDQIDAAIAEIDKEIADLKAQRGRSVSLQDIASRRYPNYLYANPFQVASRGFEEFRRETEELSPLAAARYVPALAEQEGPFPVLRATRELERTEPIRRAGGIDFQKEGVDMTSGGAIQPLADALGKADEIVKAPGGVKVGDETVAKEVDATTGEPVFTVTDASGKARKVTRKEAEEFAKYAQGVQQAVFEQSGLQAAYDRLPETFAAKNLGAIMATLRTGGFAAAKAEADKFLEGGDIPLSDAYMQALRDARKITDPRARDEAITALAEKAPEDLPLREALKRIDALQDPEAVVNSAVSLLQAYNAAKGDVAAGETTVFEARTAREGQTAEREGREALPAKVRKYGEGWKAVGDLLAKGVDVEGVGKVYRAGDGTYFTEDATGARTPVSGEAKEKAQEAARVVVGVPLKPPGGLSETEARALREASVSATPALAMETAARYPTYVPERFGVDVPGLGTVRETEAGVELRPFGQDAFIRLPEGKAANDARQRAQAVSSGAAPSAALPASAAPGMADLVYGMPLPGVRTTAAALPAAAAPEARVDVRATTPAPRGTAVTPQSLATQDERDAATAAELRTLLSNPDTEAADATLAAAGLTRATAETRAKDLQAKADARKKAEDKAAAEAARAEAEAAAAAAAEREQQALKDAAAAAVLEDLRKAGAGKAGTGLSSSLEERATRAREEAAAAAVGRERQTREEAARAEALRKARAEADARARSLPASPRPRGGPAVLPAAERAGATPLTYGAPDAVIPGLTTYGTRPIGEGMPAGPSFSGREERRDIAIEAMPLPAAPVPAEEEDMFAESSITLEPEPAPAKATTKPPPAKPPPAKPPPAKPPPAKPPPAKPPPAKATPPAKAGPSQAELDAALRAMEED